MSIGINTSRTPSRAQLWMENLGEWSWPGRRGAAAEMLPPSWIPTLPPRLEHAVAAAPGVAAPGSWQPERGIIPRLGLGLGLGALAIIGATLALNRQVSLERLVGWRAGVSSPAATAPRAVPASSGPGATLTLQSRDAAGSSIDAASYPSTALHARGSFLVYLPASYASTTRRYPVLYLLHGNDQLASAFLQVGLQGELDRLIAHHSIPPLIAVMIQGGRGANNWRQFGGQDYEGYVLEVQKLVDRTLATVADRQGRAIAGDSMGGYGAMNVALSHPDRFAAVESWMGFFNGLEGRLHADRSFLSRMGLTAFVYGASGDKIADPWANPPFAAALRAGGVNAHMAIYPGEHNLETVEAHLESMLVFAGHALTPGVGGLSPKPRKYR